MSRATTATLLRFARCCFCGAGHASTSCALLRYVSADVRAAAADLVDDDEDDDE